MSKKDIASKTETNATIDFLVKESGGYLRTDDFRLNDENQNVILFFRETDAEIEIPIEEFRQLINECKTLVTSDRTFVRTNRRTLRLVAPISLNAQKMEIPDPCLTMKLERDVVLSLQKSSLLVTIAAIKNTAFHLNGMPPEAYSSVEIIYPNGVSKMEDKKEEEIIDTYLFEIASSEDLVFAKIEFVDSSELNALFEDEDSVPKLRPLEPFNEGMRLYLAAATVDDPELRLLSFFKVFEFFAPIVLGLDSMEALRKKLDSPLALTPDANYLKSIIDLVHSLDERKNDNQMIRMIFDSCIDFVELSKDLPHPRFRTLKYTDKKGEIDAQSKAVAEALVATRNQVAHAKSDYRPTGLEIPIREISDFNVFLKAAAVQAIRWYNRLPVHLRLKF